MTNGSTILNTGTVHPYFNGFMSQLCVYTVELFECEHVQEKYYLLVLVYDTLQWYKRKSRGTQAE
jgi:hypothetical protein